MKAVILAGGLGSRLLEETQSRPKPMVEVGGMPIIWHILKIYAYHGIKEFIICLGFKGPQIKEFFANYDLSLRDMTITIGGGIDWLSDPIDDWKITLVDTGLHTQTGGRLKCIKPYLDDDIFCMTYGDGLSDIDIGSLVKFHKEHKKLATVTAVQPTARFGALELEGNTVKSFVEKPISEGGWINGGFFVLHPDALDYIEGDKTIWEQEPMRKLAKDDQLQAFFHKGFWQSMDNLREKKVLEELWETGEAPWNVWG